MDLRARLSSPVGILRVVGLLGRGHRRKDVVDTEAGEGADPEHRGVTQEGQPVADVDQDVLAVLGGDELPLVEDHHRRAAGRTDPLGQPLVLVGHPGGGVDDQEGDVRPGPGRRGPAAPRSTRCPARSGTCVASRRCRRSRPSPRASRPRCPRRRGWCRGRRGSTDRSSPTSRLNSVDLPTLGRPTRATRGMPWVAGPVPTRSGRPSSPRYPRAARRRPARAIDCLGGQQADHVVEQVAGPPPVQGADRPRRPEAEGHGVPGVGLTLASESTLLTTTRTGRPERLSTRATARSSSMRPTVTSTTSRTTSASAMARSAWALTWASSGSSEDSHPPVSTTVKARPHHSASSSLRSRVTPGRSSTTAARRPTMRLTSVDLPDVGPTGDDHQRPLPWLRGPSARSGGRSSGAPRVTGTRSESGGRRHGSVTGPPTRGPGAGRARRSPPPRPAVGRSARARSSRNRPSDRQASGRR